MNEVMDAGARIGRWDVVGKWLVRFDFVACSPLDQHDKR
jgi:hypothetical protein